MELGLEGKRVIISGGSRGIGLAIAQKFLQEGAAVAFFARGEPGVTANLQIATVTAFEHHDMSVCPSYGAIKAATVNHAAQLAQNWGGKGIRSNSLSPGPIYIEGGAWQGIKENYFELYERDRLAHPADRLGSAEEVANVAVFICSPAASWVNGENVVVDGGFTKRVGF